MSLSAGSVIYTVAGGLILYSGIKGDSLADMAKAVTTGNLSGITDTEPIGTLGVSASSSTSSTGGSGSGTASDAVASGSNYMTIAEYLVKNGYSNAGAAGVVGCIAGESGGNPEANSGSGIGLIQWTGSNQSMVPALTGNATTDLDAQLPAIISYNNAQGAGLVSMLNAMTDPVQAADFYSQHFERPAVTDSDVRASVAQSVYNQLNSAATDMTTPRVSSSLWLLPSCPWSPCQSRPTLTTGTTAEAPRT